MYAAWEPCRGEENFNFCFFQKAISSLLSKGWVHLRIPFYIGIFILNDGIHSEFSVGNSDRRKQYIEMRVVLPGTPIRGTTPRITGI